MEGFQLLATHPLPPISVDYARLRDEQLARIGALAAGLDGPLLLLGDLNITPWSHPYRRLMRDSGLSDGATGFGVQPTWPAGKPPLWIPIDHTLHSEAVVVLDRRVGPDLGSDHYPVIVDFAVVPP